MSWALHCQGDQCANGNRTGRDGALPIHWNRGGLEQISSRWDSKHALINLLSNISIRKWRPDRINVPQWNRLGPSWCKSWENNEVVLLHFSPYTRGWLCYLHLTRKTKTFIEIQILINQNWNSSCLPEFLFLIGFFSLPKLCQRFWQLTLRLIMRDFWQRRFKYYIST